MFSPPNAFRYLSPSYSCPHLIPFTEKFTESRITSLTIAHRNLRLAVPTGSANTRGNSPQLSGQVPYSASLLRSSSSVYSRLSVTPTVSTPEDDAPFKT